MPTKRKLAAVLLAAVFVCCSASSAAMGEETPHFIKGGKEIVETLAATTSVKEFFVRVPSLESSVICEKVKSESSVGPKWKSKIKLEFESCTTSGVEFNNCKAVEPVTFELAGQLVYKAGKKGEEIYEVVYGSAGKTFEGVFGSIEFEGAKCVEDEEKLPVRGSAIGLPNPKKPGEEAVSNKITFAGSAMPSGKYVNQENGKEEVAGAMKFTTKEAFLEGGVTVELKSGEKFGAE